eukprot:8532312-Pyramimonas_sp.AAC.2
MSPPPACHTARPKRLQCRGRLRRAEAGRKGLRVRRAEALWSLRDGKRCVLHPPLYGTGLDPCSGRKGLRAPLGVAWQQGWEGACWGGESSSRSIVGFGNSRTIRQFRGGRFG